jgi:hypothetical protein
MLGAYPFDLRLLAKRRFESLLLVGNRSPSRLIQLNGNEHTHASLGKFAHLVIWLFGYLVIAWSGLSSMCLDQYPDN